MTTYQRLAPLHHLRDGADYHQLQEERVLESKLKKARIKYRRQSLKNLPLAQPSMANSLGASINTNRADGIGAMPLGEVSPFGEPGGAEEVAGAVCRGRAYRFLSRGCPSTV